MRSLIKVKVKAKMSKSHSCQFSEGLGVLRLPWVLLLLEGTVTFRTTKFKNFTVISDKCHPIARIAGRPTEEALLYAHFI